jgi:hypothetical protein
MFVVRKAANDPQPPLDPNEEQVSKIVQQGMTDAEKAAMSVPVKDAIASRNYEAIVDAFPWQDVKNTLDLTKEPFADATKKKIGTGFPTIQFKGRFDYTDPRATQWAIDQSARLVTAVTDEMRQQIRDVIGQAFTQNKTVVDTAKQLRTFIGLNARQQRALENFIEQNKDKPNFEKLVADYRAKAIKYRATMIARTEIITAESNGRQLGWQQSIDGGWAHPQSMKRWSAALGERTCEICAAMNGKSVRWDLPFPNGVFDAPAHVMCRCSTVLLEPDSSLAQSFMTDALAVDPPPREFLPEKAIVAIAGLQSANQAVALAHSSPSRVSSFQYDSGDIANLHVEAEAVTFNGVPSTALKMKLTPQATKDLEKSIARDNGKNWKTNKGIAVLDYQSPDGKLAFANIDQAGNLIDHPVWWSSKDEGPVIGKFGAIKGNATYTRYLPNGTAIRFIRSPEGGDSLDGFVRVVIPQKPDQKIIDETLATFLKAPRLASEKDVEVLKVNQLINVFKPNDKDLMAMGHENRKDYVEKIVGKYWGFKLADVTQELDQDGALRFLLPVETAAKIMKATGVIRIDHSLGNLLYDSNGKFDTKKVVAMFSKPTPALQSTYTRWTRGIDIEGLSSKTDVRAGGGEYVFMRPIYSQDKTLRTGSINFHAPELFRRLDWYAWANDSYGVRSPVARSLWKGETSFDNPNWFGELMAGSQAFHQPEIMFRGTVPFKHAIEMMVDKEAKVQIIAALQKAGVESINGDSLDLFFTTN